MRPLFDKPDNFLSFMRMHEKEYDFHTWSVFKQNFKPVFDKSELPRSWDAIKEQSDTRKQKRVQKGQHPASMWYGEIEAVPHPDDRAKAGKAVTKAKPALVESSEDSDQEQEETRKGFIKIDRDYEGVRLDLINTTVITVALDKDGKFGGLFALSNMIEFDAFTAAFPNSSDIREWFKADGLQFDPIGDGFFTSTIPNDRDMSQQSCWIPECFKKYAACVVPFEIAKERIHRVYQSCSDVVEHEENLLSIANKGVKARYTKYRTILGGAQGKFNTRELEEFEPELRVRQKLSKYNTRAQLLGITNDIAKLQNKNRLQDVLPLWKEHFATIFKPHIGIHETHAEILDAFHFFEELKVISKEGTERFLQDETDMQDMIKEIETAALFAKHLRKYPEGIAGFYYSMNRTPFYNAKYKAKFDAFQAELDARGEDSQQSEKSESDDDSSAEDSSDAGPKEQLTQEKAGGKGDISNPQSPGKEPGSPAKEPGSPGKEAGSPAKEAGPPGKQAGTGEKRKALAISDPATSGPDTQEVQDAQSEEPATPRPKRHHKPVTRLNPSTPR